MKKILEIYKGFKELKKLVDVASCLGANMSLIVNTYPQITGINFDLPYVIKNAPCSSSTFNLNIIWHFLINYYF